MGQQVSCCGGQKDSVGVLVKAAQAGALENDCVPDVWHMNFDNKVKWEMHADGNKVSLLHFGFASAIEENTLQFPMYGISMETLMQLDFMKTHEEMKSKGLLTKIPKDSTVHFISHQWIGNTTPDPRGIQIGRNILFALYLHGPPTPIGL